MTTTSQTLPLRFGISSLDVLTNPGCQWSSDKKGIWTAALVGPDGCGKSILALHLASNYWRDHNKNDDNDDSSIRVIYASTDFSFEQAQSQWTNFGLDYPPWREEAIEAAYNNRDRRLPAFDLKKDRLKLHSLRPTTELMHQGQHSETDLLSFLSDAVITNAGDMKNRVYFIDLQSETAGDDWGFLNHLIGLLPSRNTQPEKHLLIVDAVEGLEAFVGDQDAFGQRRDRRSRVAQLIRRATAIGVHVLFIVEEPDDGALLPERFVTDLVIRLRHHTDHKYTQRTIEIEKCRAISHVRGEHEFSIRRGTGAATGDLPNLDDPRIIWRINGRLKFERSNGYFTLGRRFKSKSKSNDKPNSFLPHIHITPSLYYRNAQYRERQISVPQLSGTPTFGLQPLDRLLSHVVRESGPLGSLSILLGESGTHKGRLARRYLAQAFVNEEESIVRADEDAGVAILLSTRFIDRDTLVDKLRIHLNLDRNGSDVTKVLRPRVFCHRFGARQLTSGAFIDILIRYLSEAFKVILPSKYANVGTFSGMEQRRAKGHRIRIVLEDWNALLAAYPNLQQEPLLLSTVLAVLRSECVSSLIVSTQPGQPGVTATDHAYELRNVDEPQVFTWAVPFYGDRRIAITAHSIGTPHRAPIICELESPKGDNERLTLNRHFDLYADVDNGKPRRVPLVVRLYFGKHVARNESISGGRFAQWLQDTFMQSFPAPTDQQSLRLEPSSEYNPLCTYTEMLDSSQLDHTLILQIDEFWSTISPQVGLLDLNRYWTMPIVWTEHEPMRGKRNKFEPTIKASGPDEREETGCEHFYFPHRDWYQPPFSKNDPTPRISSRRDAFKQTVPGSRAIGKSKRILGKAMLSRSSFFFATEDGGQPAAPLAYRIPYLWDFGIILADRELWDRYKTIKMLRRNKQREVPIGQLWDSLCRIQAGNFKLFDNSSAKCDDLETVHWQEFLEACRLISALENIPAFDVDLTTVETISCFVLELWASLEEAADSPLYNETFVHLTKHCGPTKQGLRQLLMKCGGTLLQALVQLILSCPQLRSSERTVYREHVSERAVASREWYSTAANLMKLAPGKRFIPLSLPGTHAVRGDWHLVVARGSRSEVLAARALDLLSSRRCNLLRLQDGIGLPVRDVVPDRNLGDMPSAMSCYNDQIERHVTLSYRDICRLGRSSGRDFNWLWRSQISYYQRDCFYWRRWIARMLEEQYQWLPPEARTAATLELLLRDGASLWGEFETKKISPKKSKRLHANVVALAKVFEPFYERLQILRSAVRDLDNYSRI